MNINDFEKQFNIKVSDELKSLLEFCKEDSVFFADEKRLLSIDEILNSKQELMLESNVIPLIDLYDNNFIAYDLSNNQFIKFDISDEVQYEKLDSIQKYINMLKKYFEANN